MKKPALKRVIDHDTKEEFHVSEKTIISVDETSRTHHSSGLSREIIGLISQKKEYPLRFQWMKNLTF